MQGKVSGAQLARHWPALHGPSQHWVSGVQGIPTGKHSPVLHTLPL